MLKDELDQQVRNILSKQQPIGKQKAEMEERVKEDANYVWEALKKVFIRNCFENKPITVIVGICDNDYDTGGFGHVYYTIKDRLIYEKPYRSLVFRAVKYISETMTAIQKIAESEGITCWYEGHEPRRARFLMYRTASWYCFNYTPTKSKLTNSKSKM